MASNRQRNTTQWLEFLSQNPRVEFVWLQVLSYTNNTYVRIIPVAKFTQMVETSTYISLPRAAFFLAPGDRLSEGGSPSGSFSLRPDLDTAYCQVGSHGTRAVIQCDCVDKVDGLPIKECARSRLRELSEALNTQGYIPLVGFEVEVVFMKPKRKDSDETLIYTPLSQNHSWSCITADDFAHMDFIEEIVRSLSDVGIAVENLHTEAAPGQWEFVLPPDSPVKAIDMLLRARETIRNVARSSGLHATLHPRTSPDHAGTGAHVHISVNTPDGSTAETKTIRALDESFFAGIIHHMPSILAFTLPQEASYERLMTGIWSGGEYACWGWENKEAPLRRIESNRFELKLMDGLANPYLALCAIMSAGVNGIKTIMSLFGGDCSTAPAGLNKNEREALGIKILLPKTIQESLAALEADGALRTLLDDAIVLKYLAVKREEAVVLAKMTLDEKRNWLIARY